MPKIGPTGEFPFGGKIKPNDRGRIGVGISVFKEARIIVFNFGTTLSYLVAPKADALMMADQYRAVVIKNFGFLTYDKTELPIRVRTVPDKGLVEMVLPSSVETLVVSPEVLLALAEKMEIAAKSL